MTADDPDAGPDTAAEDEEYNALLGLDIAEVFKRGHKALLARLVASVTAGTASHQREAILRNMLKDNGLTLGLGPERKEEAGGTPVPLDLPELPDQDYQ